MKLGFPLAGIVLLTAFSVTACVKASTYVWTPNVSQYASSVGTGIRLYVQVLDARNDGIARGDAAINFPGVITAKNKPAVLEQKLREGFNQKGYEVVESPASADAFATLRLTIDKSNCIKTGFSVYTCTADEVVTVDAGRNKSTYSNSYAATASRETSDIVNGTYDFEMENELHSGILNKILSDHALDIALTGDKASAVK